MPDPLVIGRDVALPDCLDPLIRDCVMKLRGHGVETFESCQGGAGHACPEPCVRFHGDSSEGFRALAVAMSVALPVLELRRFWQIVDREPCGPYWEMTFRRDSGDSDA